MSPGAGELRRGYRQPAERSEEHAEVTTTIQGICAEAAFHMCCIIIMFFAQVSSVAFPVSLLCHHDI